MIPKGEILGSLQDPQEYFDSPQSEMELKIMQAQTALLTRVIEAKSGGAVKKPKAQAKEEVLVGPWVRTDFGSRVPPDEENRKARVHIRDAKGSVPDHKGELNPGGSEQAEATNKKEAEEYGHAGRHNISLRANGRVAGCRLTTGRIEGEGLEHAQKMSGCFWIRRETRQTECRSLHTGEGGCKPHRRVYVLQLASKETSA
jgi:hypothetical protein